MYQNKKNKTMRNKKEYTEWLTIKTLLSLTLADVDIFLLKDQDQLTDKDKLFTVDEIRNQLIKTGHKVINVLNKQGIDTNDIIEIKDFGYKIKNRTDYL